MRTQNLICGRPPVFGDRQQIKIVREAEDKYNGLIPVAKLKTSVFRIDDDYRDVYEFRCVCHDCKTDNAFYTNRYDADFIGKSMYCKSIDCLTEYRVGEDLNLYHNPKD